MFKPDSTIEINSPTCQNSIILLTEEQKKTDDLTVFATNILKDKPHQTFW